MSLFQKRFSILTGCLLALITNVGAEASTNVSLVVNAPPAREIVVAPRGYANCYFVESEFNGDVWVNRHQVCEYENMTSGDTWISGYWQCLHYNRSERMCLRWSWVRGHWERRISSSDGFGMSVQINGGNPHPHHHHHHNNHHVETHVVDRNNGWHQH